MKPANVLLFLLLIFVTYIGGFVSGVKKIFPYDIARQIKEQIEKRNSKKNSGLDTCEIKKILELPLFFSVVIGHAYGSPEKSSLDDFIASNVEHFLEKNKSKIKNIILTGDVFAVPTSSKWQELFTKFSKANIYIAPGNHDISRPDSKEIFLRNIFIKKNFPFVLSFHENINMVVDDSISSNWGVSEDLMLLLKNLSKENIFVARHNIPILELLHFANSRAGNPNIPLVRDFLNDFSENQNITWIMGDGGAFEALPRLTCHTFKNHRFIINGIGEVKNDTVLILHNGDIFSYIIR